MRSAGTAPAGLPSRLRFLIARGLRDEARLQAWSVPEAAVLQELAGRSVAIVGNARSLGSGNRGAEIDGHDLVLRINAAPIPSVLSHGTRTDWMAISVPVPDDILAARAPSLVLWMTPKRRRLPYSLFRRVPVFLNPAGRNAELVLALGARPTTGMMAIDLCLRAQAQVDLYGFDFFQSKSLSGHRDAAQVPHDFAAEKLWVEARLASDPKLRLVPPEAR